MNIINKNWRLKLVEPPIFIPKKETGMREIIQNLNKATLAEATGISYSRLRKFSTGLVSTLTPEEREKIYKYLLSIADKFKN